MWNIIGTTPEVSEENMERLVDDPSNGMMPNRAVIPLFDMLKVYLERREVSLQPFVLTMPRIDRRSSEKTST